MAEGSEADERLEPWADADFRADLQSYAAGSAEVSRRFAADARLLARLASRVPREVGDTRGATAWTSFLGELAVARRGSTQAAAAAVADADLLVGLMPVALGLLEDGALVVPRARALLEACRPCPDELVRLVDEQLAARAVDLVPARIRAAVDRLVLQHDVDLAALRSARAAAGRGTRLSPLPDAQAELSLCGPAVALAQARAALDADARLWQDALRGTGDHRGLDQLRFDLGVHRLLGTHAPVVDPTLALAPEGASADLPGSLACLPDPACPQWWTDRRFSRPVRLDLTVPVTTALGLADEPGWLPGYGWLGAPLVRQLLPVAELRRLAVAAEGPSAGQLVDTAETVERPGATLDQVRAALLRAAVEPVPVTDKTWRQEPRHDPSTGLAGFVRQRDRYDDSPLGTRPLRATDADLDHDKPYADSPRDDGLYDASPDDRSPRDHGAEQADEPHVDGRARPPGPAASSPAALPDDVRSVPVQLRHGDMGLAYDPATSWLTMVDLGHPDVGPDTLPLLDRPGPTAAWNLRGRGRRAHGLKHRGWTPLRTATSTLWWTPAGQRLTVPHDLDPPLLLPEDARLRDPEEQHAADAALLAPVAPLADAVAKPKKEPVVEAAVDEAQDEPASDEPPF